MLLSLNWLRDLVRFSERPEVLADRLTMTGSEVESIERPGKNLSGVVIARVTDLSPHPSREGLRGARVTWKGKEAFCVTGAPNVAVGDLVPYAPPGATLADGTALGVRDFDDWRSEGMVLSAEELGQPSVATDFGILILPEDAPEGEDAAAWLGLDDVILDVSVTPNRGDLLSLVGLAREVHALLPSSELLPGSDFPLEEGEWPVSFDGIALQDRGCPFYALGYAENLRMGPSPVRARVRLALSGMRPISNVVDATNYVMLFWGQPLHAFDYDRLPARHILVRGASEGEVLRTLDGKDRVLVDRDLCITSGGIPVALAGVMGGEATEIVPGTRRVALESAIFASDRVRSTSRRLGMRSEASNRFARGVDRCKSLPALRHALTLFRDWAGGDVAFLPRTSGDDRPEPRTVTLRAPVLKKFTLKDDMDHAKAVLDRLGFEELSRSAEAAEFAVPSWRLDVGIEEDLVEEVARLDGYDQVPSRIPSNLHHPGLPTPEVRTDRRLREIAMGRGFTEVVTYSFVSPGSLERLAFPPDDPRSRPLRVANPLSAEQSVLRPSMMPGLLGVVEHNLRGGWRNAIRIFEIGRVFLRQGEGHVEPPRLGGVAYAGKDRRFGEEAETFLGVKADIEALCRGCGARVEFHQGSQPFGHAGRTALITVGNVSLGYLAQIKPSLARELNVEEGLFVFELDTAPLMDWGQALFPEPARYPAAYRDVSFLASEGVPVIETAREVRRLGGERVASVRLFDVYSGQGVPEGQHSLAFSVAWRHPDRTLGEGEVDSLQSALREALAARGYVLR